MIRNVTINVTNPAIIQRASTGKGGPLHANERRGKAIKRMLQNWRSSSRPEALRKKFEPHLAFVRARLSRESVMGLQLTLSALVLIGAGWLFGGIAEDVVTGDPLTVVDVLVADWLHVHATPAVTKWMLVITHANGPSAIVIFSALVSVYLLAKRDWYWLTALIVVVPGGMLLNVLMKYAFQRTRPHFDDPLLVLTTYSFPSGHVAGATLFYGLLTAYMVAHITEWRWRAAIAVLALLIVVAVAASRMYLGVHYLSDVLAAFAEGLAWLVLCLTALRTWRHTAARP